jgi:ribosomal protein S18 acetylase RimI-like enzyme
VSDVRPLASASEVLDAAGGDTYVRSSISPGREVSGWAADGGDGRAVAWLLADSTSGWLTAIGGPAAAGRLVEAAADAAIAGGPPLRALSVPRGTLPLLPRGLRPPRYEDWDWFWTNGMATAPLPGEAFVHWLTPQADEEIAALLDSDSPRHSARPGEHFVRRWCGIRDETGALIACAAHVEYVVGVPHLASIVTRNDRRRMGLGSAVTAWLTRRLLDEGLPLVTLGMYADNDVARRVYGRLGYRLEHRFSSGRLDPPPR